MVDHPTVSGIGKGKRSTGMCAVVAPALATNTAGGEIVHALLHTLIAKVIVRPEGIELIRGYFTEILNEFGHLINASPEFIAKGKHTEGWMVAIPAQDVLTLFMEESHQRVILLVKATPERQFWLKDDSQLVCCDKGSLRWTP